jgi:starch phosphorylase
MDGANVEIREEVGDDNIFIFGLLADEVVKLKSSGYNPKTYYEKNPELKQVVDMIATNYFNQKEYGIFDDMVRGLLNIDYYLLFPDYQSYVDAQDKVAELYLDKKEWTKKSILNVARVAKFSSDRSVDEYANKIWKVKPVKNNHS